MRRRGAHGRLTSADRLELRRRVAAGERFEEAAASVGCSAKSVQRLLAATGGAAANDVEVAPSLVTGRAGRDLAWP